MAALPTWVFDTSSICEIRRALRNEDKPAVFRLMSELVEQGRLIYPAQVVAELKRRANPEEPDPQYRWAAANEAIAAAHAECSFDEVAAVLAVVPDVLDPDKDSGVEEADPYVLAVALRLRETGIDARVVTEEHRDTPSKMSLGTAAGILGLPSVPLRGFLSREGQASAPALVR